jgi:hypothetical protein
MADWHATKWPMSSAAGARMLDGERSRPSAMNTQVVWNGTEVESHDLLVAIGRHCTCESAPNGARTRMCAAHEALVRSQRFLDGLLFARRLADRFIAEEWGTAQLHSVYSPSVSG